MEITRMMELLRAPFSDDELEFRVGATNRDKTKGLALAYVQARAIQNRLDEVFGINGWKTSYREISGGFICSLSVKINNEWITKEDGANDTDFEPIKGGISNAFKRVASSGFGIGRYLYEVENQWHPIKQVGKSFVFSNPGAITLKMKNTNGNDKKPNKIQSIPDIRNKIGMDTAKSIYNFLIKKYGEEGANSMITGIFKLFKIKGLAELSQENLQLLKQHRFNLEKIAASF